MTEQEISELAMSGKTVHEIIVEAFGRGMEAKRKRAVRDLKALCGEWQGIMGDSPEQGKRALRDALKLDCFKQFRGTTKEAHAKE